MGAGILFFLLPPMASFEAFRLECLQGSFSEVGCLQLTAQRLFFGFNPCLQRGPSILKRFRG